MSRTEASAWSRPVSGAPRRGPGRAVRVTPGRCAAWGTAGERARDAGERVRERRGGSAVERRFQRQPSGSPRRSGAGRGAVVGSAMSREPARRSPKTSSGLESTQLSKDRHPHPMQSVR